MRRLFIAIAAIGALGVMGPATATTADVIAGPNVHVLDGADVTTSTVRARVAWSTDATEICAQKFQVRKNTGPWRGLAVGPTTPPSSYRNYRFAYDATYRFRVMVAEPGPNGCTFDPFTWTTSNAAIFTLAQEPSETFQFAGTWNRVAADGALGGSVYTSSDPVYAAVGYFDQVLWVTNRGPNRTRAALNHYNGTTLIRRTIDLFAPTYQPLVTFAQHDQDGDGPIWFEGLATDGRPRIDVDAVVGLRHRHR